MDGNGRWASGRNLPRTTGHQAGVESAREVIKICAKKGIKVLSLFAFSSENWKRPTQEVKFLMDLLFRELSTEAENLHKNNICLKFIGDHTPLDIKLRQQIADAEALTRDNAGMKLVVAINYGGRWDIIQATKAIVQQVVASTVGIEDITNQLFEKKLSLSDLPDPDLFIRPSGEQRISNFFLWQLAYAELYFPNIYWPDFNADELEKALKFYEKRQRRFGLLAEQLKEK